MQVACATTPTNIAVIKYWGKRDSKLNLPINSSLSVTLHQDDLRTVTTAAASKEFERDRVWLNGKEEDVDGNKRVLAVFNAIRERAGDKIDADGNVIVAKEDWPQYKIHIVSKNSFPTAAGLASSASGYACLVQSLAELFAVKEAYPGELTMIARMGSGSASRSLYGGFVKWDMGTKEDGTDSIASQVASEDTWDIHALICVVSDHKKTTSSTGGMTDSVNTSELLKHRADKVVPVRMAIMEKAILEKDFPTFAETTMKDSNQFHATCLDTYPPIKYMNDTSHAIVQLVHKINQEAGKPIAAYTYDAGPNAVIFVEAANALTVLAQLLPVVGPSNSGNIGEEFVRGQTSMSTEQILEQYPYGEDDGANRGAVKYIIHTRAGPGAQIVQPSADEPLCLVDLSTGLPKV